MTAPTIVALSGGVDSAVAAWLLLRAGHAVEGLHMTNWVEDDDGYCTAADDWQAARTVGETLGIPVHRVSFAEEYRAKVFADFLAGYAAGRTPNPDILCNREVKFGACLEYVDRLGGGRLATGHYARIADGPAGPRLLRAIDPNKDQSYFLQQMPRTALARAVFPLGDLPKPEVRRLAREAGLPVAERPDSTGICFIGERPFREFLSRYLAPKPGPIETPEGLVVGEHTGLMFHTVGQRGGLGIGGRKDRPDLPWYVAGKDLERNALIVVQGAEHPLLSQSHLSTEPVQWLVDEPAATFEGEVQIRHRQTPVPATIHWTAAGATIALHQPVRGVAPGQYAALYRGDDCLGGAPIR
jgi:tRNA-uridine 2-sulfurtransferase